MPNRLVLAAVLLLSGCDRLTEPEPSPPPPPPLHTVLDGSWRAIYWLAHPAGAPVVDVIALGGTLTLEVVGGHVSGVMFIPPEVTGGGPASADMAGLVLVAGDTAQFVQGQDTFVQRARWTISQDALYVIDQPVESTRFTVVLVRGW